MVSEVQEVVEEEASIYELLFKLPSIPSSISPSVVRVARGWVLIVHVIRKWVESVKTVFPFLVDSSYKSSLHYIIMTSL